MKMEECIEIEDIHNISISSLVTSPFAVQWSMDNQISLITEKGVHTFELMPLPMSPQPQIKFSRSFIYPPKDIPGQVIASDVNKLLWKLDREDIYKLLLEEALTPKVDDTSLATLRIINVAWSPQDLIHPSKCILAILTSVGAVELLTRVSSDWYTICELSSCWLTTELLGDILPNLNMHAYKSKRLGPILKNLRKIQACAITWSELYILEQDSYAFLVTAYCSSELAIWYIPKVKNFMVPLKPVMSCRTSLKNDSRINTLCWITLPITKEYLIIVGYINGQIEGLKYRQNDTDPKKLEYISTETYYSCQDQMPVSCFEVISHNKSEIMIIASKSCFLMSLCLTDKGVLKYTDHLQLEGFTITGVIKMSDKELLVSTQDAKMVMVRVNGQHLTAHYAFKQNIPQTRVQYLGLACSPNSAMFINITSPNSLYDHLVTREPSIMYVFALRGKKWDPLPILLNSKSKEQSSLKYFWDVLELIRSRAVRDTCDSSNLAPLFSTVNSISRNLESLSLHDLRIAMWLTVIAEVSKKRKMIQGVENIVGEISEAQPLIFLHSACGFLSHLLQNRKSELSKEQKTAITMLRMYLESYLATEEDRKETEASSYARKTVSITKCIESAEVEVCYLCGEAIDGVFTWNTSKCPKGHKLPRCALTLLQIPTVRYLVCPICKRIFHPMLNEEFDEPRCLFCDVPALFDSRVMNITSSGFYMKNLSQQKIETESSTNEQMEAD